MTSLKSTSSHGPASQSKSAQANIVLLLETSHHSGPVRRRLEQSLLHIAQMGQVGGQQVDPVGRLARVQDFSRQSCPWIGRAVLPFCPMAIKQCPVAEIPGCACGT
jgi:hypothetical protein